jgi:phosphoesterase RecJ-like protein
MSLELRRQHLASSDDTQSFLNLLLLIRDSEIVCFFREEDDGKVRVSMKSKGKIPISRLAMELGGGGHEFAAGVALTSSLSKSVSIVINRIEALIHNYERFQK